MGTESTNTDLGQAAPCMPGVRISANTWRCWLDISFPMLPIHSWPLSVNEGYNLLSELIFLPQYFYQCNGGWMMLETLRKKYMAKTAASQFSHPPARRVTKVSPLSTVQNGWTRTSKIRASSDYCQTSEQLQTHLVFGVLLFLFWVCLIVCFSICLCVCTFCEKSKGEAEITQ